MEVLFSVVLPVYNVEKYLKQCLDSICASQENLEIIAVDDGSTDGSLQLLQNYPDTRLKVFHKENEGLFKTWQYGVRQATGRYIIFVDSDDYINPKLFTDMKNILSERDYDLIQFQNYFVCEGKTVNIDKNAPVYTDEGPFEGEALQKYLDEHLHNPKDPYIFFPTPRWGKVVRAQLLKDFLPNLLQGRIDMFEDDSFSLPFATTLNSLYISRGLYYYYRIKRKGSICSNMSLQKKWQDCQTVVDFIENFGGGIILSPEKKDYYFKRKYLEMFLFAIDGKGYKVAKEILSNERFQETIVSKTGGFKGFLWRHKMVRTFHFFRTVSSIFE